MCFHEIAACQYLQSIVSSQEKGIGLSQIIQEKKRLIIPHFNTIIDAIS